MSIFERFAKAFPLVSDEGKRWDKEGPLITELARESGGKSGRVLDLGCGAGFHARQIAMAGFEVTGVDISKEAIEEGRDLPGGDRVVWTVGDITQFNGTGFDLVLLIGNTLSLFNEEGSINKLFLTASNALVDEGVFVLHIIDFAYLRRNPVCIRREGELDGKKVIFNKEIIGDSSGANIIIKIETEGEESESEIQRIYEHDMSNLIRIAKLAGLEKFREYGSMSKTEWIPGTTKDIVTLFRK